MAASKGVAPTKLRKLSNISGAYAVTMIVVSIISVVLYIHTALWIYNISRKENCSCADDWRKQYILYFPPASIATVIFLFPFFPSVVPLVSFIMMIGWIVFIVSALQYVRKLRSNNCACATSGNGDEALQVYAYVPIVSWSISILFIIAILVIVSTMRK